MQFEPKFWLETRCGRCRAGLAQRAGKNSVYAANPIILLDKTAGMGEQAGGAMRC